MKVPLLNLLGGPGITLLNFEGGPGVPLLNLGESWVPGSRCPGFRGPGPTFTPCRLNIPKIVFVHTKFIDIKFSFTISDPNLALPNLLKSR